MNVGLLWSLFEISLYQWQKLTQKYEYRFIILLEMELYI
jgi:hypothetical protein